MNYRSRRWAAFLLLCAPLPALADYPAEVLADNPVAYWRLDDADGTTIADSSGNNRDGAVDGFEGSITFGEPGLLPTEAGNGSITLAGLDRIIVPGFDKIGPDGYTVEYWIHLEQLPGGFLNLVGDGTGGGEFFMMNYTNAGGIIRPHYSFANTPVSLDTPGGTLVPGMTAHVVTTWDATSSTNNGRIYVNGALLTETNVTQNQDPANESNAVYIGRDDRENRAANFKIDEVALYDFPLSEARVAAHYAAGTDGIQLPANYEEEVLFDQPLAYWRLGDATGPVVGDSSGNGRDATADPEVTFGEDSLIPPDPNPAIGLQSGAGVVSPGFQKSDAGTSLDFWVQINSPPADGEFSNLVGDREAGVAGDGHLFVEAGGAGIVRASVQTESGTTSVDSPELLVDERMHHVVATWDAASGDLLLHVDGVEVASANQPGPAGVANTDHPIVIGGGGDGSGLFDGVIDEVAVYDFPLAPARIAARYNRVEVPPPPPPPVVNGAYAAQVLADGPVAYWRLGETDGSVIFDRSGNNHHGMQDGAAGSIVFNGESLVPAEANDGSIGLAGFDRLVFPGFEKIGEAGYTAEYWVKVTAYPDACCDSFVSDGEAGGDFFMMNYLIGPGQGDTGAVRPHFSFGNTPVSLTTTQPDVLELDTIYHVVTTWDVAAGEGNIYFNGELVLSGPVTGNVPPPGTTGDNMIFIGRDNRENRPSNFMIDEVALYDYPLTAEQVLNHFNVGINPEPLRVNLTDIRYAADRNELDISWESKSGKLYNLRSVADPSTGPPLDWPVFSGNENLDATPPENTLSFPLPADPQRFFVVEEFNAPPVVLFSDDFEGGQGDWTTGVDGAAGTEWELGAPSGSGPAAANSGANAFGTNIGGDYESDANVWLRSPALDLTTAGAATLRYFQSRDIESMFDSGTVSILDAADDSLLVELAGGIDGTNLDWQEVSHVLPPAALGKTIKIEFRFESDDFGNFSGWYIDDVVVTIP